jgi:soluble epoxide hydrolase/lipid-phosphate phosphatase
MIHLIDMLSQIHATYDTTCATVDNPKIMANMRRQCKKLKEAKVDASHFVAEEKPAEVNAIIAKWLLEEVEGIWPAQWAGKESVL